MSEQGGCYCGAVRYEVTELGKDGVACYCATCQKLHTGGSFNLGSSPDKVKVTKGSPKVYHDNKTDVEKYIGKAVHRYFCGDCGSALFSDPDSMPGVRFLKAGSLDNPRDVKLSKEIYVDTAIPSLLHPRNDKTKKFEGMMAKEV